MRKDNGKIKEYIGFIDVGSMVVCFTAFLLTVFDHYYLCSCLANDVHYIPDFKEGLRICFGQLPLWIPILVALFAPMLFFRREGRRLWSLGVYVIYTALTVVDLAYTRAFNTIPSVAVLKFVPNTASMDFETVARLSRYDLLLLAGFVILLVLCIKFRQVPNAIYLKGYKRVISASVIFTICSALVLTIPIANHFGKLTEQYDMLFRPDNFQEEACRGSIVTYHADDVIQAIRGRDELSKEDEKLLADYYAWRDSEKLPENEYSAIYKGKNLIIIQAESLENFVIGAKIENTEITPNINALLGESIYFPTVYQQVRSGNSIDCDFMVATSLLPTTYGTIFPDRLGDSFTTFAQSMGEAGYRTKYYNVTAESAWAYEDAVCDSLHYDELYSDEYGDIAPEDRLNGYLSDAKMLAQTAQFLVDQEKNDDSPYLAHIVLASSHLPFNITEDLERLPKTDELKDTTLYDYLCLMHYVDAAIGDFIKTLDDAQMLDDTVIVIYGDHGGIHRYYPIECDRLCKKDGLSWVGKSGVPTVPLIVYSKGGEEKRVDIVAGQIDIMPTLSSLFGVSYGKYALGRNLLNTNRSFALTTGGEVICGNGYSLDAEGARLIPKLWRLCEKMIDGDKC